MFSEIKDRISRRRMLGITAAGAAGAVVAACSPAAPAASPAAGGQAAPAAQGSVTTLKIQSGWPVADWHFTNLKVFTEYVEAMSNGRLKFELLGSGTVVPTADMVEAASKGLIDGAHTNGGLWYGKNVALSLFASAAGGPFGMNNDDFLGWYHVGEGHALHEELLQKEMKLNVVTFALFGESPEPLGWFPKPIKSSADLKGLKFRAAGLAADVFKEFGMPVASIAPGEIVPALERGTLDASEYSDPSADMSAGFHEVRKYYMMPGIHQPTGLMDLMINKTKFDGLSKDLQAMIKVASMAETLDFTLRMVDKNATDLKTMVDKHGVNVVETPREILTDVLKAWDKVAEKYSKENAMFAKIYASQKAYAQKVVGFRRVDHPPYDLAADYYWAKENPYKVQKP